VHDWAVTEAQGTVVVLPGVPNMDGLVVDDGRVPYPDTTPDFVKILRRHGLTVTFSEPREDRRYVTHKAFELWLPIVNFVFDALLALEAGILAELLKDYLYGEPDDGGGDAQAPEPGILHIDWRVSRSDGTAEEFKANGSPAAVLEAVGEFEKHLRDG